MDLKEIGAINPASHWYYQAKVFTFKKSAKQYSQCPKTVFDIGAGSGFFATELVRSTNAHEGICIDPFYTPEQIRKAGRIEFCHRPKSKSADIYIFADVLEHVEDDVGLLTEYVSNAREGALFLISVPAFMSLWSGHDEYLEHHRRYKLADLVSVVESANLTILESRYLFGMLFPIALIKRRIIRRNKTKSDLSEAPFGLNFILSMLFKLESRFIVNHFFGLSVYIAARA